MHVISNSSLIIDPKIKMILDKLPSNLFAEGNPNLDLL